MTSGSLTRTVFTGPQSKDSPNLDLLRAFAVLYVLIAHVFQAFGNPNLGSLGRFGVVLFFVHTSYVLMASLERTGGNAASFAIRRFFRIYPLAVFCILFVPVLHIPIFPGAPYQWHGSAWFFANITLTQNLFFVSAAVGPLWSLPLEVQMYCLLPVLYLFTRRSPRWAFAIWPVALCAALTVPRFIARANVLSFGPCFASGILAHMLVHSKVRRSLPALLWPLTIVAVTLVFQPFEDIPLTDKLPLAWALSLIVGIAIPFTREFTNATVHRVTHLIAKYSYGIYLTHVIVLWVVVDVMRESASVVRLLVLVAGIIGSPVILYHAIEEPMIRFGVSLSRKLDIVRT